MAYKPRKYAMMSVEVKIGTTPASIRDIISDIALAAEYNSLHSEEAGSPSHKDQLAIAKILHKAAIDIEVESRKNWSK